MGRDIEEQVAEMQPGGAATIDELLTSEAGEFGKAQWLALGVGGLTFFSVAVVMFVATFTAPSDPTVDPNAWKCVALDDLQCQAVWAALAGGSPLPSTPPAHPSNMSATTWNTSDGQQASYCDLNPEQVEWVNPQLSLATEFDLVCDSQWRLEFLDTTFFVGFMTGNGVLGRLADAYGRRTVIAGAATATLVTTCLSAAVTHAMFWVHLVLRAVSGAMAAGMTLAGYILVSEFVGPSWRGAAGMLAQTCYIFGEFLLVGIAAALGPAGWRVMTVAAGLTALPVLATCWQVPESPRWLLLAGKQEHAIKALQWVARLNCKQLLRAPCLGEGGSVNSCGVTSVTNGETESREEEEEEQQRLLGATTESSGTSSCVQEQNRREGVGGGTVTAACLDGVGSPDSSTAVQLPVLQPGYGRCQQYQKCDQADESHPLLAGQPQVVKSDHQCEGPAKSERSVNKCDQASPSNRVTPEVEFGKNSIQNDVSSNNQQGQAGQCAALAPFSSCQSQPQQHLQGSNNAATGSIQPGTSSAAGHGTGGSSAHHSNHHVQEPVSCTLAQPPVHTTSSTIMPTPPSVVVEGSTSPDHPQQQYSSTAPFPHPTDGSSSTMQDSPPLPASPVPSEPCLWSCTPDLVSVLVLDESQQYSSSTAAGTGGSSTVKSTGEEGSDVVTLKPARSRVRFQLGDDLTEMSGTTEVTPRKSDWHKDNTPSKSALVAVPTDADATATGTTLKEQGLASMLKHSVLARYFFTFTYTMFSLSISYFGISLALGSLSGDLKINFLLTALAELPAYLAIAATVEKLGRKAVVTWGALMTAVACIAVAFTPPGPWQVALAMAGKFGCSSGWALGMTYASELFPTGCRSAAVGSISQAGDVGGIIAPQLMLLGRALGWDRLPFLFMGVASLIGGALVTLMPETRGMPQPDTVEDMLKSLNARKRQAQLQAAADAALASAPTSESSGEAGPGEMGGVTTGGVTSHKARMARFQSFHAGRGPAYRIATSAAKTLGEQIKRALSFRR